jgi:3-oxoacyl-[acyl-carrier-protein] synthase II
MDYDDVYNYPYSSISYIISSHFGFRGPCETMYCACSGGNNAIARAMDHISAGRADVMIVGGVDILHTCIFSIFHSIRALAPEMCQPFDKNRKGMVLGEGAGILIIESLESALRHNRHIYAELSGYGLSFCAHHSLIPDPDVSGLKKSMEIALGDSGLRPDEIDYLSAYGTGMPLNDKLESRAIRCIFEGHVNDLPVSSIKSMIGHAMSASSAIEAISCCLAIEHQKIPPTINLNNPDPECDLCHVPNRAIDRTINNCMNISQGLSGINSTTIFSRCGDVAI